MYRGGLYKVVINQRFYPSIHLHQVLTVSVFRFHFPFPVSISTISNCPNPSTLSTKPTSCLHVSLFVVVNFGLRSAAYIIDETAKKSVYMDSLLELIKIVEILYN